MKIKIEYVPITDIVPYANNAKQHPPEQIEQIMASMREFGNIDPIGVWRGEIVEGHGRYMAAQKLGYDTVPIIRLDDLTDEQRKAYALAHNKLTMNSGFDIDLLNMELAEITDIDMSEFGFALDDDEGAEWFDRENREFDAPQEDNEEYNGFVDKFARASSGRASSGRASMGTKRAREGNRARAEIKSKSEVREAWQKRKRKMMKKSRVREVRLTGNPFLLRES